MRGVTRREVLSALGAAGAGGAVVAGTGRASAQSADEWPQYGVGPGNRGRHDSAVIPESDVGEQWRAGSEAQPPVADDRRVYAIERRGLVARAVGTGERLWSADVGPAVSTPVLHGDYVYAAGDGVVARLRREDGREVWRVSIPNRAIGPLRLADTGDGDQRLYVQTAAASIHALRTEDGTEVWERSPLAVRPRPMVATPDRLVVPTNQETFVLSATDGSEQWVAPGTRVGPVLAGGTLVQRTDNGTLLGNAISDGTTRWEQGFDAPIRAAPVWLGGPILLVPVGSSLRLVDSSNREELGRITLPAEVTSPPVATLGNDGFAVMVGEGRLCGGPLDAEEPIWEYEVGSPALGSPAVVDQRLLLATEAGIHSLGHVADRQPGTAESATRTSPGGATPTPGDDGPTATVGGAVDGGQQSLALPDGLTVPVGMGTLLGAAGLATLLRWARSDDSGSEPNTTATPDADPGDSGMGGGPPAGGTSATRAGTTRSGGTPAASDGLDGRGAAASPDTGGSDDGPDLGSGVEVGDTSRRPDAVPDTPDLDLSYDDLDRGDRIGTGGNADVYRATAPGPDGPVDLAVKEPRLDGTLHTETVERLMTEAETWAKLDDHEAIVSVVDYGAEPLPWIAMEYMDAGHLGDVAPGMSFVQRLWTAYGVVKGVRHAHRRGVAHLDLKPANVLFRSTGPDSWPVPKVADWGLSKHLLRHSNSVEGLTPTYAAPEQFDDSLGPTDDVTDIYQLGAVLYELFTGRPPFEGTNAQVMHAALNEDPEPPSAVEPGLPAAVDEMVLRALATDRGDRYDSVLYLRDDIRDLVQRL